MDPSQIVGTGIDAFNSLPKSTQEAMLNPAANTLGKALDGAVTVVCSPLLVLGILSKALLHKFSTEINQKINGIPQKNRDTSKLGLVVKAMEEARYQLNEDDIRKMYVSLISSTVDNRKNNVVNPRLATVIAQFGPNEAKLMNFISHSEDQLLQTSQLWAVDNDGADYWITPRFLLINKSITNKYNSSIDILRSLGIIEDFLDRRLTDENKTTKYKNMENVINKLNKQIIKNNAETTRFKNGYISLTNFGKSLAHCIFE